MLVNTLDQDSLQKTLERVKQNADITIGQKDPKLVIKKNHNKKTELARVLANFDSQKHNQETKICRYFIQDPSMTLNKIGKPDLQKVYNASLQ